MNELMRRRAMMGDDKKPKYVITAEKNPKSMRVLYDAGWCKSPDGMTAKECAAVTQNQWNRNPFHGKNFGWSESFFELRYFTQITSMPDEFFAYVRLVGTVYTPPNVISVGLSCYRLGNPYRVFYPPCLTSIGRWNILSNGNMSSVFYSTTPPTGIASQIDGTIGQIYCPDEAVVAYRTALGGTHDAQVHPISELGVGDVYKDFK